MGRRGYVAVALAVFVVVLTGMTVVKRHQADEGEPIEPISADNAYAIEDRLTCDSEVHDVPTLPLEAEPMAMLVCADPDGSMPWTAPAEMVEGDLAGLVEALADLEPTPDEPYNCTFQGGPGYDLLLRFSRERYARIHGDVGGCGVVTVASGDFFGAREVLDAALTAVEEQRAVGTAPDSLTSEDLSCDLLLDEGGIPLSPTGDSTDAVELVSCWQPSARRLGAWSEALVPTRDVRIIADDLARNASAAGDPGDLRCPGGLEHHYFQHLLDRTSWGDVLMLAGECRRFYVVDYRIDAPAEVWHPSDRSQRILDDLRR